MTPEPPSHPTLATQQLPDAVEQLAAAVVALPMHRHGAASGVLWQPGVVVTCASSFGRHWGGHRGMRGTGGGEQRLEIVLPSGEPTTATLRGSDGATDLAALAFDADAATAAAPLPRSGAAGHRAGDFVFAVGREPSGLVQASFGHVGAAAGAWRSWRGGRIEQLIRLDGGLYPGLAGAAVGDASGGCIGIASPAFSRLHGVVLPSVTIDRVLASLLAHGRVPRGYLGIAMQPVRATLDGAATNGLLVSSVADDGPAASGGVLVGDVIVSAGGQPVDSIEALRENLDAALAAGGALTLQVARGGQRQTLTLAVRERSRSRCQ